MPTIETALVATLKADLDRLRREIELRDRTITALKKDIAANRKKSRRR